MSHVISLETSVQMTDKGCIIKAAEKLGCKTLEKAKARYWNGQFHYGDIVVQHPQSPYDLAFNKQENGAYKVEGDLWGGHIAKIYGTPGKPLSKLEAAYQAEKSKKIAKALGHTLIETVDPQTGVIRHKVVISNG